MSVCHVRKIVLPNITAKDVRTEKPSLAAHTYLTEVRRQRTMLLYMYLQQEQYDRIARTIAMLLADRYFVSMLFEERLDSLPRRLAGRIAAPMMTSGRRKRADHALRPKLSARAVEPLRKRRIFVGTFAVLEKMEPYDQAIAVRRMIGADCFRPSYALELLKSPARAVTPPQHVAYTPAERALLISELESSRREIEAAREQYVPDYLDLLFARRYLARLLANRRLSAYLSAQYPKVLRELQEIGKLTDT